MEKKLFCEYSYSFFEYQVPFGVSVTVKTTRQLRLMLLQTPVFARILDSGGPPRGPPALLSHLDPLKTHVDAGASTLYEIWGTFGFWNVHFGNWKMGYIVSSRYCVVTSMSVTSGFWCSNSCLHYKDRDLFQVSFSCLNIILTIGFKERAHLIITWALRGPKIPFSVVLRYVLQF